MQRLPWLVFDNLLSEGLDKIFLNANVHIIDDSVLADGSGSSKYITIISIADLGGTITTIADLLATSQWQSITTIEVGGIIFNTITDYKVGDVVTKDNTATSKVYRCITDTTAGAMVSAEWKQLSEQGGVEFDAAVYYNKGDMVTDSVPTPAKTYFSISAAVNVGNDPKTTPAFWQELNAVYYNSTTGGDLNGDGALDLLDGSVVGDGGGRHCPWLIGTGGALTPAWVSGTTYNPGDEVNYLGWKYSALVLTTTPLIAPDVSAEWQLISADGEPDLGSPNTLGEYPNTNVNLDDTEKIGASWVISGLGFNRHGEKYKYLMTTGTLVGVEIKDGDQITWVDGATGSEIWFFSPAPEVSGERGGLLWVSGKNYIIGDIVGGSDGKQYTSIWQSAGMDPTDQVLNDWAWSCTTEGGGLEWDSAKTYPRGAIVAILETWPSGVKMVEQYLSVLDNNKSNNPTTDVGTNWSVYNVSKWLDYSLTVRVGTSGAADFPHLQDALNHLVRYTMVNGAVLTILMETGFIDDMPLNQIGSNFGGMELHAEDNLIKLRALAGQTETTHVELLGCKFPTIKDNIDFDIGSDNVTWIMNITDNSTVSASNIEITWDDERNIEIGLRVSRGSSMISDTSTITGIASEFIITVNAGGTGSFFGSALTNNHSSSGMTARARSGGSLNIEDATVRCWTGFGSIRANDGGHISATNASLRHQGGAGGDLPTDIVVSNGGIIYANNTIGGVNQTVNTITASGIIFR